MGNSILHRSLSLIAGVGAVAFSSAVASAALTITPIFDSSITSDPNAAAMMAGINNAVAQVQSNLSNNVTVRIKFVSDESVGLGQSGTYLNTLSYSQYRADLLANQTLSANDTTALATLPAGANNPVNGGTTVSLTLPLLRAIGETALGDSSGTPNQIDSTISLKMSLMNFVRTGAQDPDKYDLQQVTLHEINEVVGAGGAGSTLGEAGTTIGSLDLYRYGAAGVRSFSTSAASSYFSIDGGVTNLSLFNQTAGGDYADWDGQANPLPQVQDAFSGPGNQLNLGTNELTSLDVVGWNLTAVPEPASAGVLCVGGVALLMRRRRGRAV